MNNHNNKIKDNKDLEVDTFLKSSTIITKYLKSLNLI